jgi:hypothetical protein
MLPDPLEPNIPFQVQLAGYGSIGVIAHQAVAFAESEVAK